MVHGNESESAAIIDILAASTPSTPQQHDNIGTTSDTNEAEDEEASNNQNKLAVDGASTVLSSDSDEMKRAHAKQLIEKYFYRLTDGCGDSNCTNRNCVSSGAVESLTPNQAAARAIQLFSEEAPLCGIPATKLSRIANASNTEVAPETHSAANNFAAKLAKTNDAHR